MSSERQIPFGRRVKTPALPRGKRNDVFAYGGVFTHKFTHSWTKWFR